MKIENAKFISSKVKLEDLPKDNLPEFAFIGRSNVGKSSLINYLTHQPGLAKTSSTPGKTQTINHFLVNNSFYFVDLPGYGYANVPQKMLQSMEKMVKTYLLKRPNLFYLFILIDIRHKPLKIDLDFIQWAGEHQIPLGIVFTKVDKVSNQQMLQNIENYKKKLLETWEQLPNMFITSSEKKIGEKEILDFIQFSLNQNLL
jgi:GTP-binding protein